MESHICMKQPRSVELGDKARSVSQKKKKKN